MKVNYILLISLLIVGALFIPAVSAFEEVLEDSYVSSQTYSWPDGATPITLDSINVLDIRTLDGWTFFYFRSTVAGGHWSTVAEKPYYSEEVTLKVGSTVVGHGTAYYNGLRDVDGIYRKAQFWLDIHSFDYGSLAGQQVISIIPEDGPLFNNVQGTLYDYASIVDEDHPIGFGSGFRGGGDYIVRKNYYWKNVVIVEDNTFKIIRNIDGIAYTSSLNLTHNDIIVQDKSSNDLAIPYDGTGTWNVTNTRNKLYTGTLTPPTETEEPTVMRTGTVTMTDNNGTTITGFDVTAVNHYTGEEYTVATETDVAVMTLPMDRTIEIRNPQTGVYEESPVGYYRFYGQSPGYKMLYEDGIQVSVMPEKYTSYELCNIGVTPESGPLTGKHLFQIRSRSDNSVLQTGTVSAKSATTGEWFNTTVSGGIATLILPYDTSNTISQYAGNYYVYATSPGYEDSDYGTQIVVMPHTVSEIRDIHLTPIGGIPTSGNVTLRIQTFSETGPGVVNAEIFIAGVLGDGASVWDTYTSSSTGYLTVSVPGNSTYDIVASGTGYYDSARRVQVFTENPPLIEIKLYLSGAPTVEPTTQPTGWVTPTVTPTVRPTDVAPGNNPIDNFRIMFLNMGFDDNYTDWLTGLFIICIGAALGYCLVKKVGAMCGAPIGLLTAVGLGLIPIWALVLIIVIVALAYAKFFMGR